MNFFPGFESQPYSIFATPGPEIRLVDVTCLYAMFDFRILVLCACTDIHTDIHLFRAWHV